jgi:hypothetical protein
MAAARERLSKHVLALMDKREIIQVELKDGVFCVVRAEIIYAEDKVIP